MRKFLAVLLTVLMLVGAVAILPTSAAVLTSEFDGTKSDAKVDLVITEMLINSKTGIQSLDNVLASGSVSVFSSPDAFDYIEIYNRGTEPVDIYKYAIYSADASNFAGDNKEYEQNVNEDNKYKFTMKNVIVPGSIHSTSAPANAASGSEQDYNQCVNPSGGTDGYINPGEFAVIWFWTTATDSVCKAVGDNNGKRVGTQWEGDNRTFPYFRDYYKIDDSVKVFATNAKASSGSTDIYNDLRNGWIYALVDETLGGSNLVSLNSKVVSKVGTTLTLNSRVACMAEYSTGTATGIVTTDNMDDFSAYYVPATCLPDLYNKNQANVIDSNNETALADAKAAAEAKGETFDEAAFKASNKWQTFTPATDYVGIKYAQSYKETAIVSFMEDPTPGGMPAWQWLYVDPVTAGTTYQHGLPVLEAKIYAETQAAADAMVEAGTIDAADRDSTASALFNNRMNKLVTDWLDNADIKTAEGRLLAETGETTWQTKAMENFEKNYVAEIQEEEDNAETKKDYSENFVSREELEEKHKDKNTKKKTEKKGLPVWALILIIVGAVVVVGGVVVVVIVVVKKKGGKATASDDVAAEGDILVVDETADETPADAEAPAAEEAPAEETKTEE
ncbi:MAG: hypothetical protein E7590_10130 [Ruminococcaceae bacterium]|nr:hypothetical protein [Oscillospiraceae bacterium]